MLTRRRVREWLEERFFLRIHMTLILIGTFVAGVVATRVLMLGGVNVLALRYAGAVCLAYLVFLVLVKLWLMYVGSEGRVDADVSDVIDVALGNSSSAPALPLRTSARSGGSSTSWSLDLDFGDDLAGLVLMIVLVAIVLLLGGIAIYFIYTAPALLGEAAFEAVLAASIARRARRAEGKGWIGAVWRATVLPFVGVLVLAVALGWIAQKRCPDALRLRDALHCGQR